MKYREIVLFLTAASILTSCGSADDFFEVHYVEPDDPPVTKPDKPHSTTDIDPGQPGETILPGGSKGVEGDPEDDFGDVDPSGVVVTEPFSLSLVDPASGRIEGGYEIRVQGKQIGSHARVMIGNVESPQTTFVTSSLVRALVPPGKRGCVDVSVVQEDGERVTLEKAFCYTERLGVDAVSPAQTVEGQVTPIRLMGHGFSDQTHFYARVGKDVRPLIDVTRRGDGFEAILPAFDAGAVDILVNSDSDYAEKLAAMVIMPAIEVDRLLPRVIPAQTATALTLTGKAFGRDNMAVRIGGASATVDQATSTTLNVTTPKLAAGCYAVLVYDQWRQTQVDGGLWVNDDVTTTQLLGVWPDRCPTTGCEATVMGVGLNASAPKFGSATAELIDATDTALHVQVPAAVAGSVDVSLADASLTSAFTYVQMPSAKSLEPNTGSAATLVTLHGNGFDDSLRVFVDQFEAANVDVIDAQTAVVTMPEGSGLATLQLVQQGLTQPTTLTFQYVDNPSVIGIDPRQVATIGGSTTALYGTGFSDNMTLWVDGVEVTSFTRRSPGQIEFMVPPHEVGDAVVELKNNGKSVGTQTIQYFEPGSRNTNVSGGMLDGRIYVTVLTVDTNEIIPDAEVFVGTDKGNYLSGKTNAAGQIAFENDQLVGAQSLYACKAGYSCNTLQSFDAKNVTIYLQKWEWTDLNSKTHVETDITPPPQDGEFTINPVDVTIEKMPENTYFTGHVSGFGKVTLESDPDVVRAAVVIQSQLSPYRTYDQNDIYMIFEEQGQYRIKARKGEVALGLVCGLYHRKTGAFDPRYFGLKSGFYVTNGQTIQADLTCPLPLNQTQRVKFLNLPYASYATSLYSTAYLNLGNAGYIGGFMTGYSENDYVVISKVPPLRGDLENATFAIQTQLSVNGAGVGSIYSYDVSKDESTVEIGPIVSWPRLDRLPDENYFRQEGVERTHNARALLERGIVTWSVDHPEYVDFYDMTIRGYYYIKNSNGVVMAVDKQLLWQFYLPGNATSAEFAPRDYAREDGSEPEYIYITLTAYKTIRNGYDFNQFTTLDTKNYYIDSAISTTLYVPWQNMNVMNP